MDERQASLTAHPSPNDRIARLQLRLRRAIVSRCGSQNLDDLVQEANVAPPERTATDADFLLQSDCYLVNWGIWRAQDANKRRRTYEGFAPLFPEAGEDDASPMEALPGAMTDLDTAIAVQGVLAGLNGKTRAVATMLMQGYRKAEIADRLGMRKQSISWHTQKIRRRLSGVAMA